MERIYKHPNVAVERLLEELANQGVNMKLLDDFAKRAAERRTAFQSNGDVTISSACPTMNGKE